MDKTDCCGCGVCVCCLACSVVPLMCWWCHLLAGLLPNLSLSLLYCAQRKPILIPATAPHAS